MIPMEIMQTIANTVQHCQRGILLYINGPIQISKLPMAVAPSHKPWHKPCKCLGATLDTNDNHRKEEIGNDEHPSPRLHGILCRLIHSAEFVARGESIDH